MANTSDIRNGLCIEVENGRLLWGIDPKDIGDWTSEKLKETNVINEM